MTLVKCFIDLDISKYDRINDSFNRDISCIEYNSQEEKDELTECIKQRNSSNKTQKLSNKLLFGFTSILRKCIQISIKCLLKVLSDDIFI